MSSLLGDQRLVLFEKWAVYLQNVHSLKSVSGIVKFVFEDQAFLPHFKGACVHRPQRVSCLLSASEDRISLVSICNLGLF
jgi:hypothetical protein